MGLTGCADGDHGAQSGQRGRLGGANNAASLACTRNNLQWATTCTWAILCMRRRPWRWLRVYRKKGPHAGSHSGNAARLAGEVICLKPLRQGPLTCMQANEGARSRRGSAYPWRTVLLAKCSAGEGAIIGQWCTPGTFTCEACNACLGDSPKQISKENEAWKQV